ncbi:12048_t:CDS:1, partial [Cetraspora pellucida]
KNYLIQLAIKVLCLWKELTPHIKFMTPGTDLCEICELLKAQIRSTNNDNEKELI